MFQLKWNKNAVPGKPLKRKLSGTDEEEKCKKNRNIKKIMIFFQSGESSWFIRPNVL
jgi:hypothetical protein